MRVLFRSERRERQWLPFLKSGFRSQNLDVQTSGDFADHFPSYVLLLSSPNSVFWGGSGSLSPRGLGRWVQRDNAGHRHGRAGRAEDVGEPSGPWRVAGPLRSSPRVCLFSGGLISSSPLAGGGSREGHVCAQLTTESSEKHRSHAWVLYKERTS